jgi:RNA polymerase sigma-70 factor (ECF subfamily)
VVAENLYQGELRTEASPDQVYDRSWALTLQEKVRNQLQDEYDRHGKAKRFTVLEAYLPGETASQSYAEAGAELGVSEGAIKVEVHRLKHRFSELLRSEIAHTVAHEAEIDGEVRYLVEVLALG